MKKTMLMAMMAMAAVANAQKPCKVEGKVEGDPTLTKITIEVGKPGVFGEFTDPDTVEVKKGKFTYTAKVDAVVQGWISRLDGQSKQPFSVYLVPGETLKLTVKDSEHFYDGSKIYKECNKADEILTPYSKAVTEYYQYAIGLLQKTPQDKQQDVAVGLNDTLHTKSAAYEEASKKYFQENKDVEGAVLFLNDRVDEEMYNGLSDGMKNGRVGQFIKSRLDYVARLQAEQERQAAEEQAKLDAMKGAPAKDFTLNDLEGKPLSLSSLRGKYVVLDFWGSWCGWCIKGIPDMKKYYEKYAGKFEILGIDCNDSDEAWRKAVKQYELPWLHVYNPRESTVLADYAIQGFPTKIVIDPEGRVAKIIVGEDPAFYTYLDEILGK